MNWVFCNLRISHLRERVEFKFPENTLKACFLRIKTRF